MVCAVCAPKTEASTTMKSQVTTFLDKRKHGEIRFTPEEMKAWVLHSERKGATGQNAKTDAKELEDQYAAIAVAEKNAKIRAKIASNNQGSTDAGFKLDLPG
jgi:hypothetical protein